MLNYKIHAENNSLYNTPNTFGIYILGLTLKWLKSLGGLPAIARINQRKAALYAEIDRTGFYRGTAQKDSRSLMNVTFRLATEELEKQFVKESTAAGLDGPGTAPSAACARRSTRFPEEGVDALVDFEGVRAETRITAGSARLSVTVFRGRQAGGAGVAGAAAGRPPRPRFSLERPGRFDEPTPVLEQLRRAAVDVEPRQRLAERAAVVSARLARGDVHVGQPALQAQHLPQPFDVAAPAVIPSAGAGSFPLSPGSRAPPDRPRRAGR